MRNKSKGIARTYLMGGSAIALIAGALGGGALAQTQTQTPSANTENVTEIVVIGARAAQQSAIQRKKNSDTASDSIIADDVGAFPDSNLSEAISRIAGMGIDRDETGEGVGLTLRGNDADLTRVEMDGMSVAAGGYSLATSDDSAGRGADLRELPADLIESVDVIKGNTPDITEGGLGGTVRINTRSSLSLKKPYFSMRVAADRNSISERWTPNVNLIGSRKFMEGRLGVIFNLSASRRLNNSHSYTSSGASANRGYILSRDFEDEGADKTFSWNADALSGAEADLVPYYNSTYPRASWGLDGGGTFNAYTPRELLTLAAAADTKADCTTGALAPLTAAGLQAIGMSNSGRRNAAIAQRVREQQTCLNQWNDYLPEQIRYMNTTKYENRLAWDVRFDYRLNDNLTVYAKYTETGRDTQNIQRQRSFNNMVGTGVVIDPDSVELDNHRVTALSYTGATMSHDNLSHEEDWFSRYILTGGNFKMGDLKIDFQASRSDSEFERTYKRLARGFTIDGVTHMAVDSEGVWHVTTPDTFDETDMTNTLRLSASNSAQPLVRETNLIFQGQISETREDAAKFDATYRLRDIPFFTSFKMGASYRDVTTSVWKGASSRPADGVTVPGSGSTSSGRLRVCENQSTTTAANSCQYDLVMGTGTGSRFGIETITPERWLEIMEASNVVNKGEFMPGVGGFDGMQLWDSIDVEKAFSMTEATLNYNLGCLKVCRGSDGNLYEMNFNETTEQVTAAYYMASFEHKLPFEMDLSGNFGVRMVESKVRGAGFMNLNYTYKNSDWNELEGYGNVTTVTANRAVSVEKTYRDWLPSYNLALWVVPDQLVVRYNWAKTVARPPVSRIWPAGTCTYDERLADLQDDIGSGDDEDGISLMGCGSGAGNAIGNADLKPYTATKNNTSVEWYINKDTFVSLAYYRQKVRIGSPEAYATTGSPFAGSNEVDPVSGRLLSDLEFNYWTWRNRPGETQSGWEFSSKAALTFLPGHLRYTGVDFNISTNDSTGGSYTDPITGEGLGLPGRSNYFANLALWFDNGTTNARLSYQMRDKVFWRLAQPNGYNPIPTLYNNPTMSNYDLPYIPDDPMYTGEYRYLDGKITHKLNANVSFYLEGRNLLKFTRDRMGAENRGFDLIDRQYGGRRFNVGFTIRN
ncbi:MAG: TonB-dependent receptor [Asticcacaulis sp.]